MKKMEKGGSYDRRKIIHPSPLFLLSSSPQPTLAKFKKASAMIVSTKMRLRGFRIQISYFESRAFLKQFLLGSAPRAAEEGTSTDAGGGEERESGESEGLML